MNNTTTSTSITENTPIEVTPYRGVGKEACAASRYVSTKNMWLYALMTFHVLMWTIIPTWVRSALPIDSMESTLWGRQLEWGYDKNPYLNAWLSELAIKIAGQTDWILYLFAQLAIAICFFALWRLARKFLSPVHALIAVFLLEGIQYFNLAGIDFNDNLIELPLWALITLFFYRALQQQKTLDWILTGLFAGLSMMDKYFTVLLLIPLALFLVSTTVGRSSFKKIGLYLGLGIFTVVITPHVVWLFQHDFITVQYAFNRVSSPPSLLTHISHPLYFALLQLATFLPALILFSVVYFGRGHQPAISQQQVLTLFQKQFLLVAGLGPFLLTILLSGLTGITLQTMWGTPLLILWTMLLLAWVQPAVSLWQWRRFIVAVITLMALLLIGFIIAYSHTGNTSKAQFPGKVIGMDLTKRWHEQFHTPLSFVAGPRWFAGNISFYSPDRPAVYIDWQINVSPWINEQQLKKSGAIFVWEITPLQKNIPADIAMRFPSLKILPIQYYHWMKDQNAAPLPLGVGFLPPGN